MFAEITTFCFAASYSVAFILEVTRMFFRSGVRGALMLGFAGAGLLAHTLYLVNWWFGATPREPLSSAHDWYLVAGWILVVIYFYFVYYHPRNPIGLFTLPLVLGLIAAAHFWPSRAPFPPAEGAFLWRRAHGGFLLLGTVAVFVGFVAGLMYLVQAYRLRHKLPPRPGLELPSLEWLSKVSERAIVCSVVFLLGGVATGLRLSLLAHEYVDWSDAVVVSSAALTGWMVVVAVFNFAYRPARQGRKVAYLTVGTFIFLVVTLAALLWGHDSPGGRA